jgi:type II secretory pathway predicted ATPase ExeA
MLPLPLPEPGGSIEALVPLLNLGSRNELVLTVMWLLATLRSRGPYPVLAMSGEQGSAKTVLSKLLKALIDPNAAPVRALAREERDLMIAANHSYLLAFDNLSDLRPRSPTRFAGSQAAGALRSGNSIPTMTRYCFRQRALFF